MVLVDFFKTYNNMKAPKICLESMLVIVGNYSIRVRLCRHCGSNYTPFVRPTTRPSRALGSRDMGRNVQHQVEKNMENTMETFRSSRDKWIHESYRGSRNRVNICHPKSLENAYPSISEESNFIAPPKPSQVWNFWWHPI